MGLSYKGFITLPKGGMKVKNVSSLNPLVHLNFENNINDTTGNIIPTLVGGNGYVTTNGDTGLNISNTSTWVQLSGLAELVNGIDHTLAFKVKNWNGVLMGNNFAGSNYGIYITLDSQKFYLNQSGGNLSNQSYWNSVSVNNTTDTIHSLIVQIIYPNKIKVVFDGTSVYDGDFDVPWALSNDLMCIATRRNTTSYHGLGQIFDFKVFDSILSDAELSKL